MKKLIILLTLIPCFVQAQFVKQGVATSSGNTFTLNGISQSPYAGRLFCKTAVNLNNNFDLTFNAYLGNVFNNGMAFLFIPGAVPTASNPPCVINTDNIHNFGTGSIATDFVIEFDIRGSFCVSGQNTSYEPTTDINHVSYWKNNSSCTFGNYYSPYSALGTINYYAYEPYRIKWTKSTNTLQTYYNNVLIKSNVVDLVALLGTTVYWGFSSGCYCVTGGPSIKDMFLNGTRLLPFSITGFTAEKKNSSVKLNWESNSEQNTSHFIVEKSIDGSNFSALQRVEASGNSSTQKSYTATDAKPIYGTNFYRLKMIDLDGKFTYSDIVAIKVNNDSYMVSVFPNPVQNELQIQIPATVNAACIIQLQDISGKLIRQKTVQLNNTLLSTSINVEDLGKGIYLVVVQYGDTKETQKIIKQ
jgi:hypothetical protein